MFDGKEFHRNQVETAQMSLFTEEDETQMRLDSYTYEAKELLCFNMTEKEMSYEEIAFSDFSCGFGVYRNSGCGSYGCCHGRRGQHHL